MRCKKCGKEVDRLFEGLCVRCLGDRAMEVADGVEQRNLNQYKSPNLTIEPEMLDEAILHISTLLDDVKVGDNG